MNKDHHETHFEAYIVKKLQDQGWLVGDSKKYNTEYALYPDDIVGWLEETQPEKWEKIQKGNAHGATEALMKRLATSLSKHSTIHVLRQGFNFAGAGPISMSESAPEDKRNKEVIKRYKANRLRVVPQLKYHPVREFAIDLVFFINGIPVATVEVKTDFTQSADAAVEQYKTDRLPFDPKTRRIEPLLTFKRGAVVHFAMSDSEIQMTTKLDGEDSFFLPFNKGNNGHAGNPQRSDGEYPVAYFWEEICQKDAWLRIFHSFVYVQKKDVVDLQGNWKVRETQIFPRYHQWAAVNAMIADAKANGVGQQYLCEHSAGSGKTSTIAWTAHDLIKLREDNGDSIFNSIIIVTDRTVLDSQLQNAVRQIDHQFGVIAAIDRETSSKSKSKQLTEALLNSTPIIVVTIQTFPYALEAIVTEDKLKKNNFAVIIDEAHTSQTGTSASKLQATLSMSNMKAMNVEELLEKLQQSRVRPSNISHFAFTATPKHSTLMLFGRTKDGKSASKDNLPESFHRYPMRQAIEEEFILDVLNGYMPYKTAFNLSKQTEDKKRVKGREAKKALAQWMNLHPTNVTQKVQFIIEHFHKNVAHLLGGKAKAMVVTSSRAAVVRYKKGFDAYVESHPEYGHIKALVAFSGKISGHQVIHAADDVFTDDIFAVQKNDEFTEINMNPPTTGQDLRTSFDRPEYRLMLVANKFQTGFDQPKLVAMYIDKKIGNDIEIVQTFSRLNRRYAGKKDTFIIDFVNSPENVKRAFRMFDDGADIVEAQDMNIVYEIKEDLDAAEIYNIDNLEKFKIARFKTIQDITNAHEPQHKALYDATESPTRVYNERQKDLVKQITHWEAAFEQAKVQKNKDGMEAAEHQRKTYSQQLSALTQFKSDLGKFCRTYTYIAQLIDFGDTNLEVFAAFAKLLLHRLKKLPKDDVDLTGIMLSGYSIKMQEKPEGGGEDSHEKIPLKPITRDTAVPNPENVDYLNEIIERLNKIFGEATPLADQAAFVKHIASITKENETVMAQIDTNDRENVFKGNFPGAVTDSVVRAMTSHSTLASQVLSVDKQAMVALTSFIYDLLSNKSSLDIEAIVERQSGKCVVAE